MPNVCKKPQLGGVGYTCDPSTQEADAGGFQIQGQLGLCGDILLQKKKKQKEKATW
jgi:hypothetical protein